MVGVGIGITRIYHVCKYVRIIYKEMHLLSPYHPHLVPPHEVSTPITSTAHLSQYDPLLVQPQEMITPYLSDCKNYTWCSVTIQNQWVPERSLKHAERCLLIKFWFGLVYGLRGYPHGFTDF